MSGPLEIFPWPCRPLGPVGGTLTARYQLISGVISTSVYRETRPSGTKRYRKHPAAVSPRVYRVGVLRINCEGVNRERRQP
jgi:hypothetical protein